MNVTCFRVSVRNPHDGRFLDLFLGREKNVSIAYYIGANQGQNALSSPIVLIQIEVHELHPRMSFLTLNFHFIHNRKTSPKSDIKCYRYEIFRNSPKTPDKCTLVFFYQYLYTNFILLKYYKSHWFYTFFESFMTN